MRSSPASSVQCSDLKDVRSCVFSTTVKMGNTQCSRKLPVPLPTNPFPLAQPMCLEQKHTGLHTTQG